MKGTAMIRLLGIGAMLMATIAPVDHCATAAAGSPDACCASIPAEPGQGAPASVPDASRDCAGHHLAPCCSGMLALAVTSELPVLASALRDTASRSRTIRPALRSSDPLRPPIAGS